MRTVSFDEFCELFCNHLNEKINHIINDYSLRGSNVGLDYSTHEKDNHVSYLLSPIDSNNSAVLNYLYPLMYEKYKLSIRTSLNLYDTHLKKHYNNTHHLSTFTQLVNNSLSYKGERYNTHYSKIHVNITGDDFVCDQILDNIPKSIADRCGDKKIVCEYMRYGVVEGGQFCKIDTKCVQ